MTAGSGARVRIGVDLGGTKIEVAALAPDGAVLDRRRMPTPPAYAPALSAINDLVTAVESAFGPALSVGIGAPGSPSPATGLMRNANSTWLNGRPLEADLAAALARPIRLANDANCLALSEATDGAGAGAAVVFAVIIGTGCGGGLAVDRRVRAGASGIAGEWGHTPLPWADAGERVIPPCWCGRSGCMETFVSGTGFQNDYARATGRRLPAPAILEAAEAGDAQAVAAFDRYVSRLGRGLAVVADIVDPDVIVLGGGMSNAPGLVDRLPAAIAAHVFGEAWGGRVMPAHWGDSSGVRGAAWLWND